MSNQTPTLKKLHSIADQIHTEGDQYPVVLAGVNKETNQMEFVINGRPDLVANTVMGIINVLKPHLEYVPAEDNKEELN